MNSFGAGAADPAVAAEDQAREVRLAVRAAAARLALLLRSVRHPHAPALGAWDVTETAVHVAHALEGVTALVRGGGPLIDDVWDLAGLTTTLVQGEEERDLGALADRIQGSAATFVQLLEQEAGGEPRAWLVQGHELPPEAMGGHVLNELVVHSWDIARADGVRWPVPGRPAALVLDTFVFPVLSHLGRALVDQDAAAGLRAAFDVRVRGGGQALLRFDEGDLAVDVSGPGAKACAVNVDCHLSVAPAAFLLVVWARRSQWPAIARGQLLPWGRKPWLGPQLRSLLQNP